jgi:hypothetical protein
MGVDTSNTNATLSNVGTIDLDLNSVLGIGSGNQTSETVSLTGGGHINLSGGFIGEGISGVTVVSDNTISGTGVIDFSDGGQEAHGQWINQGIIDASTPNETLILGKVIVENTGLIEATNGSLLETIVGVSHNDAQGVVEAKGANSEVELTFNLSSGNDSNAGLIAAVDSGTVLIQDQFSLDNTNGTIEAGHGSTVVLDEAFINGGFVTVLRGGLLEASLFNAPSAITGAVVTSAGTIGAEGANLTINGDVTNTGTHDANNATLEIDGAVSGGKATIEGTGEIVFNDASSTNVTFAANSDGILKLGDPQAFTGTVSGLANGDYLDFTNINFADDPTISYSSKSHVLTVTDQVTGVTDTVILKGAVGSFSAQSDGSGGTSITDPPPSNQVAVSHDQDSFTFASNLGENGAANGSPHNDAPDSAQLEFAGLAALMNQDHHDGAVDLTAHDANDHAAAMAQHAHHFLV